MTTSPLRSLQAICLLSAMALAFSSCVKDSCKQFYTYTLFKPVYLSYTDLRAAVKPTAATDLQDVGKIYYKAPYIFVNEVNKGIHVIDNTDPSSPQNVAFINIPGNLDLAVKDNVLYADSYIDLVALDISDPLHAREIWRDQGIFSQRTYNGWSADPTKGVVTDWVQADTTIEQSCTNPSPWIYFDSFYGMAASNTSSGGGTTTTTVSPGIGIAGSLSRFGMASDHLYCLDVSQMNLYDVSNASSPASQGTVFAGWGVETLFPYEDKLFVGTNTGVSIFDNTNPSSPSLLSTLSHITGCDPVVVQGNYAYYTIHSGNFCGQSFNELGIIDVSNPSSPYTLKTFGMTNPYGLGIDGNLLFICDDVSGLKMYDATDPSSLVLKQDVSAGTTRDVIAYSGWLLLVSVEGIYQFSYSNDALTQLSFLAVQHQ